MDIGREVKWDGNGFNEIDHKTILWNRPINHTVGTAEEYKISQYPSCLKTDDHLQMVIHKEFVDQGNEASDNWNFC